MKNKFKILLITGSFPPNYCGVGDYTAKILGCLQQSEEFEVNLFHRSNWELNNFWKYLKSLYAEKANVYHFQYPTEGYGYSFLPLFLIIGLFLRKTTITIHEISSRNSLAYIYTQILIFFASKVVVSNSLEYKHATRFVLNKKKIVIIPIGSNIEKSDLNINFQDRNIDLAYFGHIRPIKGIESFLETVSALNYKFKTIIVGQVLEKYLSFFESIKSQCQKLDLQLILNKDEKEVASILSNVKILYLPFPDGISNRRGTLLAAIENGCTVVSTKSPITEFNSFFDKYCYLVESNEEAVTVIENLLLLKTFPKDLTDIKYEFSWEKIVDEHLQLYKNLINLR